MSPNTHLIPMLFISVISTLKLYSIFMIYHTIRNAEKFILYNNKNIVKNNLAKLHSLRNVGWATDIVNSVELLFFYVTA